MGDFNGDGYINQADIDLIVPHFGETPSSPGWNPVFDIYPDQKIDMRDIAICTNNQGKDIWTTFPTQYTLSISSGIGGTTDPPNGSYLYDEGTLVKVTAYPSQGYIFNYWTYDVISITNPITLTITENRTLYPYFKSTAPPPPPPPPPVEPPPVEPPPRSDSLAARSVGPFGVPSCLLHQFWRLRERVFSKEVHKKLHPLV